MSKQRRPLVSDAVLSERASRMVEKLGADAPIEAAMLADRALEAGDIDETVMWLAMIRHIERLTAASATVH